MNVRAALNWCFSPTGDKAIGVELTAAGAYLFLEKSLLSECRIWMKRAAATLEPDAAPTHDELEIRTSLALSLMFTEGSTVEAHATFERGLKLAEALEETAHQLRLLSGFQVFLAQMGEFQGALEVAKRSEAVCDRMSDRESRALAAAMVGAAYHMAGDQAAAETYFRLAYERLPFAGDMLFPQFRYDNRIGAFGALAPCPVAARISGSGCRHGQRRPRSNPSAGSDLKLPLDDVHPLSFFLDGRLETSGRTGGTTDCPE
jgi:tetratricopeptide (TPR) repeat protein